MKKLTTVKRMIGKDRTDYRCMDDKLLVEEAKYNPNPELAIVLAERLEVAAKERNWYE